MHEPFLPAHGFLRQERRDMRLTKKRVMANLHLMKIHWLIIKLHIVKEFSSLMTKMHR
jgi:hypothetical protein